MEAIILAGGLGTRLKERLTDLPKPMALVSGRPFLEILLHRLRSQGFNKFILSVGYRRQAIIDRFGTTFEGAPICYAVEETSLGTGGAIRLALNQASENSVLVLNGDTFLEADFSEMLRAHLPNSDLLTMAVTQVHDVARYGGVQLEGRYVAAFTEKGRTGAGWINAGAYTLIRNFPWPGVLDEKFSFENDLLVPYVKTIRPAAFECRGRFLDIGIPADLDRAQIEIPT